MKNRAQFTIGSAILIIVIIIIIAVMMWFLLLPPSCGESDKVELVGVLRGFQKNSTGWDVMLDNVTHYFNHWDKSYTEKLLGYNITITCCKFGEHYSLLTAYINEGDK